MNKKLKFEPNTNLSIFLGINFDSNSYTAMNIKDQSLHLVHKLFFKKTRLLTMIYHNMKINKSLIIAQQ